MDHASAMTAFVQKHLVNDPKCSEVRWVIIPLQAVETYDMIAVVQSPVHHLSISVLSGHRYNLPPQCNVNARAFFSCSGFR